MDKRTKEYKEALRQSRLTAATNISESNIPDGSQKQAYSEELSKTMMIAEQAVAVAEPMADPIPSDIPMKKPATAPWKEQSPWRRDTLRLVKKRPGFRPRWVDPRNFERNLEDGWTFAKREHYVGVADRIPGEEAQMDSKIRRRGLVLMEIPEEKALQREEFYANLADRAEKSIKARHNKEARENLTEPYEPKQ